MNIQDTTKCIFTDKRIITSLMICFALASLTIVSIVVYSIFIRDTNAEDEIVEEASQDTLKDKLTTAQETSLDITKATKLISLLEGFRTSLYKCPNGIPTVGIGLTEVSYKELIKKGYINDDYYNWGDDITREQADHILRMNIKMIDKACKNKMPNYNKMSPRCRAAIVSWAYQCGVGGIVRAFPEMATTQVDEYDVYMILCSKAYTGKYKARRFTEASVIIGQDKL